MELSSFWKGKKVFITGHTGFKGSWMTFWLNKLGANVAGFSLAPDQSPNLFDQLNLEDSCEHHIEDIRNLEAIKKRIIDFIKKYNASLVVLHLCMHHRAKRQLHQPFVCEYVYYIINLN